MFTGRHLDEEFYEELLDLLISADMGVTTAEFVIESLKDRAFKKKIGQADDARKLMNDIMRECVDFDVPAYKYPLVILMAGVNGVGKTTAAGKLANYFVKNKNR